MIRATDRYIEEVCEGQDFVAYIDIVHYHQKILISHPNCDSFHFMEEGMSSYLAPREIGTLTRIDTGQFTTLCLTTTMRLNVQHLQNTNTDNRHP